MRDALEKRVFEVKISSKGQMVIPKALRGKYNLMEWSRVKMIMHTSKGYCAPGTVSLRLQRKDVNAD